MPEPGNIPVPETQEPADLLRLALPISQKVVLVIDLVESVRLMASDEVGTVSRWHAFVQTAQTLTIPRHKGRLVKSLGDGLMVEFENARDAADAAQAMHADIRATNSGLHADGQMLLRAGINATHVFTDHHDIYGAGVNLAARIATLAGPGETVVSASARDGLTDGLDASVEDLGDCYLKHIDDPVRAYRVGAPGAAPVVVAQREYAAPLQPTIAVIPFTARSNEPEHFAIGELIADGVIGQLSRSRDLKVISRLSSTAFRHRDAAVGDIESRLGANYVLSGSYLVNGAKVLVTAELAESASNHIAWAERLSGDVADLLEIQSELLHQLAEGAHQVVMATEVQKAVSHPLPTLTAYSMLLGGISLMHRRSAREMDIACSILTALTERFPRQPLGYAWLAKAYMLKTRQGWSRDSSHDAQEASRFARKALEFSPSDSLALTVSGIVSSHLENDTGAAGARFEDALREDPSNSLAWLYLGTLRAFQDKGAEAALACDKALALSPLDPMRYLYTGIAATAAYTHGNFDRAILLADESMRLNRSHASAQRVKVMACASQGDKEMARLAAADLLRVEPTFSIREYQRRSPQVAKALMERIVEAMAFAGLPN